ncbi:DUF3693 domain-containing protein [Xanthomonas hortorum]|uniref:DUF3693 domain-containing protein n=1 Tax=Xanthomonas hortorum TaxID=56454 RepID=UPI003CCE9622
MKSEAQTSPERTFWKRLAATAMTLAIGVSLALPVRAEAVTQGFEASPTIHYAKWSVATPVRLAGLSLTNVSSCHPF